MTYRRQRDIFSFVTRCARSGPCKILTLYSFAVLIRFKLPSKQGWSSYLSLRLVAGTQVENVASFTSQQLSVDSAATLRSQRHNTTTGIIMLMSNDYQGQKDQYTKGCTVTVTEAPDKLTSPLRRLWLTFSSQQSITINSDARR